MARIKRRGLDYFPLSTDLIHDRIVRRIMKREGDGALSTLIGALSYIYAGEGYYVRADELFYEDLSACLYQQSTDDVRRILRLAVEYGIFDADLFGKYGILTSADIQSQYIFSTKRRKASAIEADFRLVDETAPAGDEEENSPEEDTAGNRKKETKCPENETVEIKNETIKPENETTGIKNDTKTLENETSGTHSIAQHSIAKHSTSEQSIEYPLLNSSPETGGTQDAACEQSAEGRRKSSIHKEWTDADINRMQPPSDSVKRNLDGLKHNLRQFEIPLPEQYAIILKSNFGAIGHPMWRGFEALRTSHGKIHQPGRYLLSLCKGKER